MTEKIDLSKKSILIGVQLTAADAVLFLKALLVLSLILSVVFSVGVAYKVKSNDMVVCHNTIREVCDPRIITTTTTPRQEGVCLTREGEWTIC